MALQDFVDLDVRIESRGETNLVHALSSLEGRAREVTGEFQLPYEEIELAALLETSGRPDRDADLMRSVGRRLFNVVFGNDLLEIWQESIDTLERLQDDKLRIRFSAEDPRYWSVPWELLYDSQTNRYISQSDRMLFSRYVIPPHSPHQSLLDPDTRVRILVVVSSPADLGAIDSSALRVFDDVEPWIERRQTRAAFSEAPNGADEEI